MSEASPVFRKWDIWFAEFPYAVDRRIVKERPVLIISSQKNILVFALKISTKPIRDDEINTLRIEQWEKAGLKQESFIHCNAKYQLDPSALKWRIGALHPNDILLLCNRVGML